MSFGRKFDSLPHHVSPAVPVCARHAGIERIHDLVSELPGIRGPHAGPSVPASAHSPLTRPELLI
ncbi:hypothetical protein KNE206_60690 [Kitasatospora sp. NE20-6]